MNLKERKERKKFHILNIQFNFLGKLHCLEAGGQPPPPPPLVDASANNASFFYVLPMSPMLVQQY